MKKILLVEDEKNLIDIYELAFRKAGFQVAIINRPEKVVETVKAEKPNLIILDMVFYKKNGELSKELGFQALRNLQAHEETKKIPIIVFTNLSADDRASALELGAKEYITKAEAVPMEVVNRIKAWIK